MKIAILGAGAFGLALGGILLDNGYEVSYYDPKINGSTLEGTLENAAYIVLCVPSSVVPRLLSDLPKDKPLIVATKGFLSSDAFDKFKDYMVLSGPGFAADIVAKKHTSFTVTDDRLIELFNAEYISFDQTNDRRGVLMCGALKNIYAIRAGMLNLKSQTAEWHEYINSALNEMRDILALNGARAETVDLSCGKGDLELTCNLPSRNFEFGLILREDATAKPKKTVEGVSALKRVREGKLKVPDSAKILKELIEMSEAWG